MNVVVVYARLYARCLQQAVAAIGKSAWTLILPVALLIARALTLRVLLPFGMVGGIAAAFAIDALISAYLYFVGEVVGRSRVGVSDFRRSVGAYFWSIVNLNFVLWIAGYLVDGLVTGQQREIAFRAISGWRCSSC